MMILDRDGHALPAARLEWTVASCNGGGSR
ncbi:MAG: hypothetical protein QOH86_1208 [Sphingomonadales bacterium]|jgi:hypothetical protein|nr:hypothetical protein [Sphingomonadales bacterium]